LKFVISILNKPIVFGAKIYQSFFNLDDNNCVPLPNENERLNDNGLVGLHAMLIVGYDTDKQRFEIQNSWEFADQGRHFISFSYVLDHSLCFDFFILQSEN